MGYETFFASLDAKLYRNTGTYDVPVWAEITNVKNLRIPLSHAEAQAATRGNGGWDATEPTLKSLEYTFGMGWDSGDADLQEILDAWLNRTPLEVAAMDRDMDLGAEGPRATTKVIGFERAEELEDGVGVEVTLKPCVAANPPEWMVTQEAE